MTDPFDSADGSGSPTTSPPADWLQLERAVGLGDPLYTRAEISDRTGVPPHLARRLWRALGFPDAGDDEPIFTETDAVMLGMAASLAEGGAVPAEVAVQVTRVLGQSLARVADAQAMSFEHALAGEPAALTAAVEALQPTLESFLTYAWRRHLGAALHSRMMITATGGSEIVAVGFADLVGFTAASQQLDFSELAAMVERFETLAHDIIAVYGGRVIKMIGDEVMFAVGDPAAAGRIALDIADACASDELIPSARVGLRPRSHPPSTRRPLRPDRQPGEQAGEPRESRNRRRVRRAGGVGDRPA